MLKDPERVLSPSSADTAAFVSCGQSIPSFGFYDGAVWFSFTIPSTESEQNLWLELKNPNLDDICLYSCSKEKAPVCLYRTGDTHRYTQRPVNSHNYRLPLQMHVSESNRYLLRIDNHGDQFFIPLWVNSDTAIAAGDYSEQMINGAYIGLFVFVILLNLFIILIVRDNTNLFYFFYLIAFLFLQLSLSGYSFRHLWPDSPLWSNHALPFFASLSIYFICIFSIRFLQLQEMLPRYYNFFKLITYLVAGNVFLSLIPGFTAYRLSILLINFYTLVLNVSIMPGAIAVYRKNYKPARFYLLAFVMLVVGVFLFLFRNFGWVPSNLITNHSLQIGSSIEVILLTFAVIDKFKSFRDQALQKANEISELKSRQNVMLEIQVKDRTSQIEEQKLRIEEKNRSIVDSINYAKRIQQAILPPPRVVNELLPDSFVLYLPKDIVAGDFYWVDKADEKVYLAVCDCTGHGVPGAMVSVVCNTALNRSLNEFGKRLPGEIFDNTRALVLDNFARSDEEVKDGMDASLCAFDFTNKLLTWSGANNPLWIYRAAQQVMEETKGDKQPIGKTEKCSAFTTHTLHLQKGDMVYLFTDGFADQFGGANGKKLTRSVFREFLCSIAFLPSSEQGSALMGFFEKHRGGLEQVDDVCVIGVRM